ncbi:MAG: CehA/McbA family metallohydrolase [Solirubrobacterales bacterium]
MASACTLPGAVNDELSGGTTQTFGGNLPGPYRGKFIQIPFEIPAGTTGMRIRYCYDSDGPDNATGGTANDDNTTLDLGVYGPNEADPENWTMAQRRGWSGSAIKVVGIGGNGPTNEATYNLNRKAYVPGNTTRGYLPGTIQEGTWAVELGAGYIDDEPDYLADFKVEVVTSTDPDWADDGFGPDPYTPYVANPAAGWYTGDLHVHGESEPGNAPNDDSFGLGFNTVGLDFMTLVDHNNDVGRQTQFGSYDQAYPGKLIIPGTEMTTYDGHFNSQNSNVFTDFRLGEILRVDESNVDGHLDNGELTSVRDPEDPSSRFAQIQGAGGWTQINHPTTFKDAPASCRGCSWSYTDGQTDFTKVDAIEVVTGPPGIPAPNPVAMNPFVPTAIEYYEHALTTGAHVAAVGSSDDHQALEVAVGLTETVLGKAVTVVNADQLSQSGITAAVKAGHTYVKSFGPNAPDVEMTGSGSTAQPGTAIPGDSLTSDELKFSINVKKAGPTGVSPNGYKLEILKDGVPVGSTTVTGDDFTYSDFSTSATGRYSFKLSRQVSGNTLIEAYSTPIWFTFKAAPAATCETDASLCPKPSNKFSFKGVKLNKKKGTASLKVRVPSAGGISLLPSKTVKGQSKKVRKNSTIALTIKARGKAAKSLKRKGKAKVKAKVRFTPSGGKQLIKSKTVKLIKKKAKKSRKR